ncbi:porin [Colwellia sp. Bg11-28]|uniref:porin n=1 Tax=Colwellia sp. Bg11-28 TaxID=2058305 RepID=UPI000C32899E|nr:porin [Colwellia sp. Bg11-28]PKH87260.1 porin [Colwellia sp. Bg11-28]
MKNKLLNITKYSALTIAMLSSTAQAISFSEGGWTMDINGIAGGYYTSTDCEVADDASQWSTWSACAYAVEQEDTASIQSGFLPGWLNFIATTTTDSGLDIKAHFGLSPGISGKSDFGNRIAGGAQIGDMRNLYLSVTSDFGTVLVGRNSGLFQYNAAFSDTALLGVGTHADSAGALNVTFGAVGTGVTFLSFMPQITYSTPVMDGLQASVGIFQPVAIQANFGVDNRPVYNRTDTPMIQGSVTYDIDGGSKLWASFVTQEAEISGGGRDLTAKGFELGGKLVVGDFTVNASGFMGDGLGDGIMFIGGVDAEGNAVETQGYMANISYKFGANTLAAQYGVTENDEIDGAENEAISLSYFREISKGLNFTLEFTAHTTSQTGFSDAESNTISTGMILFF